MLGAIILTADHKQETKLLTIIRNKKKESNILAAINMILNKLNNFIYIYKNKIMLCNNQNTIHNLNSNMIISSSFYSNSYYSNSYYSSSYYSNSYYSSSYYSIYKEKISKENYFNNKISGIFLFNIAPFYELGNVDMLHSEDILGTLPYYVISNIIIGLLLLIINSYFSLSIKYLDKGGGFECGFTSFLQTRERYNVVFYRVSLLFLVFDLEIILAFPFPAIYQKDESFGKNNILAFLFILVIGFIYELKEGALNIVKTAHSIDVKVIDE
jgi:NADH:ubiquinone oxidoreductase subunit 3 (subunit A)